MNNDIKQEISHILDYIDNYKEPINSSNGLWEQINFGYRTYMPVYELLDDFIKDIINNKKSW